MKNKPRREKRKKKRGKNIMTDKKQGTFTTTYQCHSGNTPIFQKGNNTLFIGGWKNGAYVKPSMFVIDLTGDEDRYNKIPRGYGKRAEQMANIASATNSGWLSLPFPDYQVPKNMTTYQQWYEMANNIEEILDEGTDVLVACLGGHGRSGLFCAIVTYILTDGKMGWEKPVEKIRDLHCFEAIETAEQEQYIYDILGLDLSANKSYYASEWSNYDYYPQTSYTYKPCPLCGIQTMYVDTQGMCLGCQTKNANAPIIMDITTEMLQNVKCKCDDKNCLGTYTASLCNHTVHNKLIVDGWCEQCHYANLQAEKAMKEFPDNLDKYTAPTEETKTETMKVEMKCELCGALSTEHAFWTGICWACDKVYGEEAPDVHDTLTDGYSFVKHQCNDKDCQGIMLPDLCGHVVHNRYVQDGLCPQCLNKRALRNMKKTRNEAS